MVKDFAEDPHLGDEGEHLALAAAGAGEDVEGEHPEQERRPREAWLPRGRDWRGGRRRRTSWRCGGLGLGDDEGAQFGAGSEDAFEVDQVDARRRDQGGQAAGELEGSQEQLARAIRAGALHAVGEALNRGQFEAHGGFARIDRVFEGRLEQVLSELNEAIWRQTG